MPFTAEIRTKMAILCVGEGLTAAKAIKDAHRNVKIKYVHTSVRTGVSEDGKEVFWAWDYDIEASVKAALAMDRKSRSGNGR